MAAKAVSIRRVGECQGKLREAQISFKEISFEGKRTSGRFRKQLEWDSREVSEAARPQGTGQASSRHS